jgi:hypothetical protein
MAIARVATQLRCPEREHWAQALAPGIDEMARELRDQLDIRAGAVENDAVDMRHILLDKRDERRKARSRIACAGELDDNSQGTSLRFNPGAANENGILSAVHSEGSRRSASTLEHEGFSRTMKELLRSNDPVLVSYVSALLEEADIGFMVADLNMSVLEGSIGILPRRVLVEEGRIADARSLLNEAGIGHVIAIDQKG